MRRLRSFAVAALLAACSPSAPAPAPASPPAQPETPAAAAAATAAPAAPSQADLDAAETFARALETSLREGDVAAASGAFDAEAIADAVCAGVKVPAKELSEFREGMVKGLGPSLEQLATTWSAQQPTFKRVVSRGERLHARFRFVSDDAGIGIVDLALHAGPQGLRIDDLYNQTIGSGMVEQARQASIPALAALDRGLFERLVNAPGVTVTDMKAFGNLSTLLAKGDFAGVIATYAKLPAELRDTAAATSVHISALQRSGDDAGYVAALKRAGERFPAPLFRFALVDVYFLEKDFGKAVACVDEFMTSVERDAALLTLRALLLKESGAIDAALASQREALALEADCEYSHAKGLDVFLAAKDFAAVRDSLVFLEGLGGYSFKGNLGDPLWAEFVAAPESAPWR